MPARKGVTMQVMYLNQQQARRLKAGEGRVADGVSVYSLPEAGLGVETRLFELAPDGVLASSIGEGERHFFVLSGVGEVSAARSETTQPLGRGALLSLNPDEGFRIRNTGANVLQLLFIRPTGTAQAEPVAPAAVELPATKPAAATEAPAARPKSDVPPTKAARSGNRPQPTQVREEPAPYTSSAPVDLAAASGNTALPGEDDGAEQSRHFRVVFEGGMDEAGKGFGNYRLYPPPVAGGSRPAPISEPVEFEEMSAAQAAYQTLIHALEDLAARLQEEDQQPDDWQVDISGNNRTVVRQLQGETTPKSVKAQELLDEARSILDQFGGYTLSFSTE